LFVHEGPRAAVLAEQLDSVEQDAMHDPEHPEVAPDATTAPAQVPIDQDVITLWNVWHEDLDIMRKNIALLHAKVDDIDYKVSNMMNMFRSRSGKSTDHYNKPAKFDPKMNDKLTLIPAHLKKKYMQYWSGTFKQKRSSSATQPTDDCELITNAPSDVVTLVD
jgi:hypothetical protein